MSETTTVPPMVNRMMKFILRSPLHDMVSPSILLITFRGRKSGEMHTTPVSYSQTGDQVRIFTHARWWKNLRGGAPVTLRLRGQDVEGLAQAVEDPRLFEAELLAHLRQVPSDARWYGVTLDSQGNPKPEDVTKAAQTVVMIRVELCQVVRP